MLSRSRLRWGVGMVVVVGALISLWRNEERLSEIRATRTSNDRVWHALYAYRLDHASKCPGSLQELVGEGYLRSVPEDAWKRPPRFRCNQGEALSFEVFSDGADGVPEGIDRID
ncbi:MAG: type II secretion system protein GspG [Polyangiaceae bacterium]|nr:type II secretion system protein GspG [Polyangiaceae bacterium]